MDILFKGKRTDNDEWIIGGSLIQYSREGREVMTMIPSNAEPRNWELPAREIIPKTLGRYTGLVDRNGTKIFEGDIVKYRFYFEEECSTYFIKWDTFNASFSMATGDFAKERLDEITAGSSEVVGNIHDNYELLKGA